MIPTTIEISVVIKKYPRKRTQCFRNKSIYGFPIGKYSGKVPKVLFTLF